MANIFPIIAGLGAAYFLMRKKDGAAGTGYGTHGSGQSTNEGGFGGGPGGSTPCHLLEGIWSQPHSTSSPIAAVTDSPTLLALPLTLEAFSKADQFFLGYHNDPGADPGQDAAVFAAQKMLTEGLGCDWSKVANWTPRMVQLHDGLNTLFETGQYQA